MDPSTKIKRKPHHTQRGCKDTEIPESQGESEQKQVVAILMLEDCGLSDSFGDLG